MQFLVLMLHTKIIELVKIDFRIIVISIDRPLIDFKCRNYTFQLLRVILDFFPLCTRALSRFPFFITFFNPTLRI